MDDTGFDFGRPAEKRAPRPFEPPPWEQDAFEELQRKRAAEEAAAQQPEAAQPEQAVEAPAPAATGEKTGDVPESVVLEMMAGLAAEEPRAAQSHAWVSMVTALFLIALGAGLIMWAVAALFSSRNTGRIGQLTGAGLGMFGLFFLGMGVWLVYRTLKQRGVL